MSLSLSDDLRQAIGVEGTPLKLVDEKSGQAYVVVPEEAFRRAPTLLAEEEALERAQIPNARLLEIAKRHRPPQEWYDSDEDDLFTP